MNHIKFFSRTVLTALLILPNFVAAQEVDCASDAIKELRLGGGFLMLSNQLAKATTTYRNLQANLGEQKANALIVPELIESVKKYQNQWDTNLAQAWAPLMTCDEFKSLSTYKQQSPYARKFVSLNDKAGAAMQAQSQPLLNTAVSEALARAWTKAQSNENQ